MNHHIHLLPDDKGFDIEAHESILEAALRAGIPVNYNCSNGNCGLCKVKLLQGEVAATRHFDYVFSAAEKQQGFVLGCCHTAVTDIEVEAAVARGSEDIQAQSFTARVKKLQQVDDDLLVLHVRTPRSNRLRFLAGQYVTLHIDGHEPYSAAIASCPCEDQRLEFHIRHLPGEEFSHFIFAHPKAGQSIDIDGPYGDFILHEPSDRPLLMIAFDTGFAAIKSLMEHAVALDEDRPIYFYWLSCSADEPYMHNWCRAWADALDNVHYQHLSLNAEYPAVAREEDGARGMVSNYLAVILNDLPDLSGYEAYIAAPAMIKHMAREVLCEHGLDENNILVEPVHGNKDISCLI